MKRLVIIGAGPAGISAALYAKRANVDVTVLHKCNSALEIGHLIDNYYGVGSIDGKDLYFNGIKQATDLGIKVIEEEVSGLEFNECFEVVTNQNRYLADSVIIATGAYRNSAPVKNIKKYEGHGVSYCATCDGFFYRNKRIGVLGSGQFAAHEVEYLANITRDITIFSQGEAVDPSLSQFRVISDKITSVEGDGNIEYVLVNDEKIYLDGLFVALGSAGSVDFAKKLGLLVENNRLVVNENMETNIPGIYACGDTTKGTLQIARAVYEGMIAGSHAAKQLNAKK